MFGENELAVESEDDRFTDYARSFLSGMIASSSSPSIVTKVHTIQQSEICGDRWGKNLSVSRDRIQFRDPLIRISIDIENEKCIKCFDSTNKHFARMQRLRLGKQWILQRYMTLIRMGVLLPLLARLEVNGQNITLHASAVEKNGEIILLIGLNGSGKSGLASHLVLRHGYRLVSDNFVVANTKSLVALGVPEPLRVGPVEARDLLKVGASGIGKVFEKEQLFLPDHLKCSSGKISRVAFVSIGSEAGITRVPPSEASIRSVAMHANLCETPSHHWPSIYHAVRDKILLSELEIARTRQLFKQVGVYHIALKRSKEIGERYPFTFDNFLET